LRLPSIARAPAAWAALLALLFAPAAAAADVPDLTHVWIADGRVHAATDPDTTGTTWVVRFDEKEKEWSRPQAGPAAPVRDTLSAVRVFSGGIFDKYAQNRIDLGDGFVLVREDSGVSLEHDGAALGWPAVEADEIDRWSKEARLGLPRDDPGGRLWQLFGEKRLKNVPGPFARTKSKLWFGLAGGFASGDGQLGGLVAYDPEKQRFEVVRHKFIADAAVISLFARGEELWIGTGRFGPSALEGMRGLILYRTDRNEWRQFSIANSRISGDLIWDIALDEKHLWVTTDRGVSRYDLERRLWDSWYWHPADEGGFELTTRRPENLAEELVK
jgi:hypothetical protein